MEILTYIITGIYIFFTCYIFIIKKKKLQIKRLCITAILAALAVILNTFLYIPFIWGSVITFGAIPIMLAGFLLGPVYGMLTGILTIFGHLMLRGWTFIHPMQILTEYYFCFTALGLTGLFKRNTKKIFLLSTLICGILALLGHFLTGVIFYAEFAPAGMNPYLYSFLYNLISEGGSILIATIVLLYLPISQFEKMIGEEYE